MILIFISFWFALMSGAVENIFGHNLVSVIFHYISIGLFIIWIIGYFCANLSPQIEVVHTNLIKEIHPGVFYKEDVFGYIVCYIKNEDAGESISVKYRWDKVTFQIGDTPSITVKTYEKAYPGWYKYFKLYRLGVEEHEVVITVPIDILECEGANHKERGEL